MILNSYSYYLLIVLFPLIFKITNKRNISDILLLIFFGLSYSIPQWIRGANISSGTLFYIIMPAIVYSTGVYLSKRMSSENIYLGLILSIAICLGSWGIYTAIEDTINTGELINVLRAIEIDGETARSATGYGMMFAALLAGLGIIFAQAKNDFQKRFKFISIVASLIALFCTIHLVNRTGIVLVMISLVVCIFIDTFVNKKWIRSIIIALTIIGVFAYLANTLAFISEAVESYTARNENQAYGIATGGGRTVLMFDAVMQLFDYPFGTKRLISMYGRYAHNMWLDVGVIGGIIPFILLVIITIRFMSAIFYSLKSSNLSSFAKMYILTLSIVLFAQMFVEPVIEGVFQFFLFFIFFWGITKGYFYSHRDYNS